MRLFISAILLCFFLSPAEARTHHGAHKHHASRVHPVRHVSRRRSHRVARVISLAGNLVTVQTAAGLPITVAANLAGKFQGFIADLVASGYKPRYIGCFARGGHVSHSRHYAGAACDIDQTGWGKTARPMYHVAALAAKYGLRDGCTFRDCGHVDDGARLRRAYAHHQVKHARKSKVAALRVP